VVENMVAGCACGMLVRRVREPEVDIVHRGEGGTKATMWVPWLVRER